MRCRKSKFGDSCQMEPGDWVMAIGNPFGLCAHRHRRRHQRTQAAVPGHRRPLERHAADRRGDQPGQLRRPAAERPRRSHRHEHRDLSRTRGRAGNIGIGFAVPINTVRDLLPQLRSGKVTRGMIGVHGADRAARCARRLRPEGAEGRARRERGRQRAAAKAGVEPGDVIIEVNGKPVAKRDELVQMVVATKPGTTVPVKVLRDKQEKTLNVTVDELDLDAGDADQPVGRRRAERGLRATASASRSAT